MILKKTCLGTIAYLGGVPAVLEKFCWAWGQLVQYNTEYLSAPGQYVHYDRATVSFHSFARNSLVERFLGDWLLMLDTDHEPEPDLAARLLSAQAQTGADVMSGVYLHRAAPHSPVLYQWNDEGTALLPLADWDDSVMAFEIGSAGGGALLVKRGVFERIDRELHERPFDVTPPYGEDHSFFKRLHRLGIKPFAAPRIESPHLWVKAMTLRDYDRTALVTNDQRREVEAFR